MKKPLLILFFVFSTILSQAQTETLREKLKRKLEEFKERKTEKTIDNALNKSEQTVDEQVNKAISKKEKKVKNEQAIQSDSQNQENNNQTITNSSNKNTSSKKVVNSKFDFISGEKVIAFDDFSTTNVGDFPLGWDTNSTAEIVTIDDKPEKWFFMSKDGFFTPEYVKNMPENFTLEFDIMTRYNSNNLLAYSFYITAPTNPKQDLSNKYVKDGIYFEWNPCGGGKYITYENSEEINKNEALNLKEFDCGENSEKPSFVKFSIWRQKNRLRVYANQTKVLDIPKAFDEKLKYNTFKFGSSYMNYATADNKDEFMVSNVRYAVGAADTRSKLITDGRLVTRGILFDTNSDQIKPESNGILKEIATVLKENPTVKVKIIGHTDSDGNADLNLDLSKRRSASVKNALSTVFGVDASRLETNGKGAAEPSEPNTTPQGKANNRRVEFIKL